MSNHYGDGYQDALRDVLDKWESEGVDAARQWITDNLHADELAK